MPRHNVVGVIVRIDQPGPDEPVARVDEMSGRKQCQTPGKNLSSHLMARSRDDLRSSRATDGPASLAVLDIGAIMRLAGVNERLQRFTAALATGCFSKEFKMFMRNWSHRMLPAVIVAAVLVGPAFAQDVIKVGAPLPLTGAVSPEGLKQKRGYDIWAEAANAKGGIKAGGKTYRVEIVYADYASNTPRAVQTAERMITEDKVQFLFAPFGSGATKAASAISEKYQIPMLAPSASSAEIFDQGFKYIFSTLTGNETVSVPIAKLVTAKNKDIKRVAVLARNDLFPLAVAQEFEKAVKAQGLEVVTSERYAIGTMDHSAVITQMRAARPDWVYASGYINDLMLIRRQMNDLGLKAQVITMIAGPAYQEFAKTVGPLAENITTMSWWHPAVRYKGKDVFGSTEAFNAAWEKKYGGEADYIEAGSAACGAILQMAIEAAGSVEPAKVRDAIAAINAETFYGQVKFAAGGQINSLQPPVLQLVGGKPVVLWPDAIKSGELRFLPK